MWCAACWTPAPRAANLSCLCAAPNGTFNVSNFHERQCPGGPKVVAAAVGATAAAVVAVLGAVAVGVTVRRRRRKAATTTAAAGWGKRESAGTHGQPRYISHGAESGPTAATAATAPGASVAPEYENVFISPCVGTGTAPAHGGTPGWQQAQYSPQVPADDTYFMESDAGEQPIYANTGPPARRSTSSPTSEGTGTLAGCGGVTAARWP
ncbi:leucine-rich repeat-containing protein 25-like [Anas acuta]|uniref:leucine-rich repeat-containing protein 25-like n=1 Tax=Anas acuta TaxID=28680 RepID=UPI0035C91C0F